MHIEAPFILPYDSQQGASYFSPCQLRSVWVSDAPAKVVPYVSPGGVTEFNQDSCRPASIGGYLIDLSNPATIAALTQLGFAGLVFAIVGFVFVIFWKKLIPFYTEKKWPAEHALKVKRIEAEIEARKAEVEETRLMRMALEKMSTVGERQNLLIQQHDEKAGTAAENIVGLLRILLEKQQVPPAVIEAVLKTQAHSDKDTEMLLRRIIKTAQEAATVEAKP